MAARAVVMNGTAERRESNRIVMPAGEGGEGRTRKGGEGGESFMLHGRRLSIGN